MPDNCPLTGDDVFLFVDTADDYSSPTWVKLVECGDIDFDASHVEVEVNKRTPTKTAVGGRQEWSLSATVNVAPGDTLWEKIKSAKESKGKIHLAFAYGDIADNSIDYYHAWWFLRGSGSFQLDTQATISIEGKPHGCALPTEGAAIAKTPAS